MRAISVKATLVGYTISFDTSPLKFALILHCPVCYVDECAQQHQ